MNNVNLQSLLVEYLEGRRYWLRAGGDNVVKYLSVNIGCGPDRLKELRKLLMDPSDVLHVERDNGKIRRVGLASWIENEVETYDIPSDISAAWLLNGELLAQLSSLQRREADAEEALVLGAAAEAELATVRQQLDDALAELAALRVTAATPVATDSEEVASLRRQLATAQSVAANAREALQLAGTRHAEDMRQLRASQPSNVTAIRPKSPVDIETMLHTISAMLKDGTLRVIPAHGGVVLTAATA